MFILGIVYYSLYSRFACYQTWLSMEENEHACTYSPELNYLEALATKTFFFSR